MASEPSSCSTGSGNRGRTWYSTRAKCVRLTWFQMLAAASPPATPLCNIGMLAQPTIVSNWFRNMNSPSAPTAPGPRRRVDDRDARSCAQLDHARAQAAQARQVEFGIAVGAAHSPRLGRRQHTVGSYHFVGIDVAHQQVFAVIVEQVDVMTGHSLAQPAPISPEKTRNRRRWASRTSSGAGPCHRRPLRPARRRLDRLAQKPAGKRGGRQGQHGCGHLIHTDS